MESPDQNTGNRGGAGGSQSGSQNQGGSSGGAAAGAVNQAADRMRGAAHGAVDKALDAAGPAAQWLGDKESAMRNMQQQACDYVQESPGKALGIAFLVGLLVGKILL